MSRGWVWPVVFAVVAGVLVLARTARSTFASLPEDTRAAYRTGVAAESPAHRHHRRGLRVDDDLRAVLDQPAVARRHPARGTRCWPRRSKPPPRRRRLGAPVDPSGARHRPGRDRRRRADAPASQWLPRRPPRVRLRPHRSTDQASAVQRGGDRRRRARGAGWRRRRSPGGRSAPTSACSSKRSPGVAATRRTRRCRCSGPCTSSSPTSASRCYAPARARDRASARPRGAGRAAPVDRVPVVRQLTSQLVTVVGRGAVARLSPDDVFRVLAVGAGGVPGVRSGVDLVRRGVRRAALLASAFVVCATPAALAAPGQSTGDLGVETRSSHWVQIVAIGLVLTAALVVYCVRAVRRSLPPGTTLAGRERCGPTRRGSRSGACCWSARPCSRSGRCRMR